MGKISQNETLVGLTSTGNVIRFHFFPYKWKKMLIADCVAFINLSK